MRPLPRATFAETSCARAWVCASSAVNIRPFKVSRLPPNGNRRARAKEGVLLEFGAGFSALGVGVCVEPRFPILRAFVSTLKEEI